MHSDEKTTPTLNRLLQNLRRRLVRQVWLHGMGTLLGVTTVWLLFALFADFVLRVPFAVRAMHGLALILITGWFVWRDLVRPLLRIPDRAGLAILYERANPELRQLFVSAVQFEDTPSAGAGELIARVQAEAERQAEGLGSKGVLEEEGPRARFLLGTVAAIALTALALSQPLHARIFANRLFGGGLHWPQKTHLTVWIPDLGSGTQVESTPEHIAVRVARGTDIPVRITAEGKIPDAVSLNFVGGREVSLSSTGTGVFRTLLQALQTDLAFRVTGGDDLDGEPVVEITVLQPPDLEGLAMEVLPPAYTGLAAQRVHDHDVEVVQGSTVRVALLPSPPQATGRAHLVPATRTLELTPVPWIASEQDAGPGDVTPLVQGTEGDGEMLGLGFELVANESVGFRIELEDESGLTNPDPGLYRVRVVDDRTPEVNVLTPIRTEFEIVRGGTIPLRVRAEDDFGLQELRWSATLAASQDDRVAASGRFALRTLDEEQPEGAPGLSGGRIRKALGTTRLEVDSLGNETEPVTVDQRYTFQIVAVDNRQPRPGEGRSVPLRARVVTPEELLRRLQDRLGQARLSATRLADLQREKKARVEVLLDAIGSDSLASGEALTLNAALTGQRRVRADARALARDLAAVAEDILYSRLDEKAEALLEYYHARASEAFDAGLDPTPFRQLAAAQRDGQLGPSGFAGNLVELVDLAFEISEDHAAEAASALDRAEKALEVGDVQIALLEGREHQKLALARLDDLLGELAEWDNFQNVLALTRDILNRQKALRERTQQFGSEKK